MEFLGDILQVGNWQLLLEVEIALCRWQDTLSWAAGGAVRSPSQCLTVLSKLSAWCCRPRLVLICGFGSLG